MFRTLALGLVSAMTTFVLLVIAGIGIGVAVRPAEPDKLRTVFFEMDLPAGWSCQRESSEFLCWAGDIPDGASHSAVAVIAQKMRGPQDSLTEYAVYLSQPRSFSIDAEEKVTSKVLRVGPRILGERTWIEGVHDGSEIPNYQTHYLTTLTSHAAIAVTFSVHNAQIEDYLPDFEKSIASLDVYQRFDLAARD